MGLLLSCFPNIITTNDDDDDDDDNVPLSSCVPHRSLGVFPFSARKNNPVSFSQLSPSSHTNTQTTQTHSTTLGAACPGDLRPGDFSVRVTEESVVEPVPGVGGLLAQLARIPEDQVRRLQAGVHRAAHFYRYYAERDDSPPTDVRVLCVLFVLPMIVCACVVYVLLRQRKNQTFKPPHACECIDTK
jgi:hypothetical protein